MRTFLVISGVFAISATLACTFVSGREEPRSAASESVGVAVVELFTSEGCSSCPPADDVLAKLVERSRAKDATGSERRVYPLAFHVDYWNSLGWRDRFSDAAFSERQRRYAEASKFRQVYTPQMIVNGTAEFVGSDAAAAGRAIAEAQSRAAAVAVKLTLEPSKTAKVYDVRYAVSGLAPKPADAVLNVALVERGLETAVQRGENGGRKLAHENVVRWFKTIDLATTADGAISVPLPEGVIREHASVIAYVQRKEVGAVLGAAAADLP